MAPPRPPKKPREELARASAAASHWLNRAEGDQREAAQRNYDYIQKRIRQTGGALTKPEYDIVKEWVPKPPQPPKPQVTVERPKVTVERPKYKPGDPGYSITSQAERDRMIGAFQSKDPKKIEKVFQQQGFPQPTTKAQAQAQARQLTKRLLNSQRAATDRALAHPLDIEGNTELIGYKNAWRLAQDTKDRQAQQPKPQGEGWVGGVTKAVDWVVPERAERGLRKGERYAGMVPYLGEPIKDLKNITAAVAMSFPAMGETAWKDLKGETRWAFANMVKEGLGQWGESIQKATPLPSFDEIGKAWDEGKGFKGKLTSLGKMEAKDIKRAGIEWRDRPFTSAINVVPGITMGMRIAEIPMLARNMRRLNPHLSEVQILKAARKESYVPGWAARNGIKGGIPPRLLKARYGEGEGVPEGGFTAAGRPLSRSPLGRKIQKSYDKWSRGETGLIKPAGPVLGRFTETRRASRALKRKRTLAYERDRVTALRQMDVITGYIRQSGLVDKAKNELLNRIDENKARISETYYGPQGPRDLAVEQTLKAVSQDLQGIAREGGLDIPTEKLNRIDKALSKVDRSMDRFGIQVNTRQGLWADARNVMREAGYAEPLIEGNIELAAAVARAWAKRQPGRDPQEWMDSPEGRNIMGFVHGAPDPNAMERSLYQAAFPDDRPTSPLRPLPDDMRKNRNRAVHVRALRAGKAKWDEIMPDGSKRTRNVSEKQQGLRFNNEPTNGPDGKPLFGQTTAYEDLTPRWEQGFREAFPDATDAELVEAMLKSASFYEEKVFPYLGRVLHSREVQAWLASQKGASPERGLLDLTKVIERAMLHEPIGSRDIGLASQTMARIIYGERNISEGAAAKLTDFSDVGHTQTATRTFVDNDPEAGIPYVSDRWEARAKGLVDADFIETLYKKFDATLQEQGYISYGNWETLRRQASDEATVWKKEKEAGGQDVSMAQRDQERDRRLRAYEQDHTKTTGEKTIVPDMGTGLTAVQYEHVSDWGAGLVQHLNDVEYLGKSDWNAASGQALDWAGFQHYVGVHPENVDWALMRQERPVSFEIAITGRLAEKFPEVGEMDDAARAALTKFVADTVINVAAQRSGAIPIRTTVGYGGWMTYVNPSVRSGVLAADRVFRSYVDNLRDLLDEDEVWGVEGGSHGQFTQLSLVSPELTDPVKLKAVWAALSAEHPEFVGFTPHPDGGFSSILVTEDGLPVPKSSAFQRTVDATIGRLEQEHGVTIDGGWDVLGLVRSSREKGALDAYLEEQLGRPDAARSPALRGRRADARAPEARLRTTTADRRAVEDRIRDGLDIWGAEGTAGLEREARVSGRINDPEALPETTRVTKTETLGRRPELGKKGDVVGQSLILRQASPEGEIRGAVQFLDSNRGRQLVYMSDKADASTFAHEMFGHAAEEMSLELPDEFAKVEKRIGKKLADWSEVEHEDFARQMERYLRTGKAPIPELQPIFDQAKRWMSVVYETIRALGRPINPETKRLFDRYFGKEPVDFTPPKRLRRGLPAVGDIEAIGRLVDETSVLLDRGIEVLANDPKDRVRIAGNMRWLEEQVLPYVGEMDSALATRMHDLFDRFDEAKSGQSVFSPEQRQAIALRGKLIDQRAREVDRMSQTLAAQPDEAILHMAGDVKDALDEAETLEDLEAAVADLKDVGYEFDRRTEYDFQRQKQLERQVKDLKRALDPKRKVEKDKRDEAIAVMREISDQMTEIFVTVFGEGLDAEGVAALRATLQRRANVVTTRLREQGLIPEGTGDASYIPHHSIFDELFSAMRGPVKLPAAGRNRKFLSMKQRADKTAFGKGLNKLVRYQTGELQVDPRSLLSAYKQRLRFLETAALRKQLWDVAIEVPVNKAGNPRIPEGWYVLKAPGAAVPERMKAAARMSDEEFDDLVGAGEDFESQLHTEAGTSKMLEEYRDSFLSKKNEGIPSSWDKQGLRMLPPDVVETMVGRVFQTAPGGTFSSVMGLLSIGGRVATIFSHPLGYINANIAANSMMLALTKPSMLPRAAMEFFKTPLSLRRKHPDIYEDMSTLGGDIKAEAGIPTFYVRAQSKAENLERGVTGAARSYAGWLGEVADQPFRVAAIAGEMRRQGYTTPKQWRDLMDARDPESVRLVEEISQRARENMLDFNKMSDAEQMMARYLFIWPFIRAATAWPVWMLREYPGRMAALVNAPAAQQAAYEGTELEGKSVLDRYNAVMPAGERSMFDISDVPMFGGTINMNPINPVGPAAEKLTDVAGMLQNPTDLTALGDIWNPGFVELAKGVLGDRGMDWEKVFASTVPGASFVEAAMTPKKRGAQKYTDRDSFIDYLRRREGRFWPEDVDPETVKESAEKEKDKLDTRKTWEKNTEEEMGNVDKVFAALEKAGRPVNSKQQAAVKLSVNAYNHIPAYEDDLKDELGKTDLDMIDKIEAVERVAREFFPVSSKNWIKKRSWVEALPKDKRGTSMDQAGYKQWLRDQIATGRDMAYEVGRNRGVIKD